MNQPRYRFEDWASVYPDGTYSVTARTYPAGWDITWYVEPTPEGGWTIWRSVPSNETLYIKTTGTLGRAVLAVVTKTIARRASAGNQAVEGVQ